jgi:branched-chain amino acid transport system substrate-binding protein
LTLIDTDHRAAGLLAVALIHVDLPDRYVFNYRASYAEETAAVVNYLVKVKHISPVQIAVFAQQDSYGDAGFAGLLPEFAQQSSDPAVN